MTKYVVMVAERYYMPYEVDAANWGEAVEKVLQQDDTIVMLEEGHEFDSEEHADDWKVGLEDSETGMTDFFNVWWLDDNNCDLLPSEESYEAPVEDA